MKDLYCLRCDHYHTEPRQPCNPQHVAEVESFLAMWSRMEEREGRKVSALEILSGIGED